MPWPPKSKQALGSSTCWDAQPANRWETVLCRERRQGVSRLAETLAGWVSCPSHLQGSVRAGPGGTDLAHEGESLGWSRSLKEAHPSDHN